MNKIAPLTLEGLATIKPETEVSLKNIATASRNSYKILVLTPDLKSICGVANYYNTLQLDMSQHQLKHFFVNTTKPENPIQKSIRMAKNYIKFICILIAQNYNLVHINPSFNKKSFIRDAIFCYLTLALKKDLLILFHGWDEEFEKKVEKSKFYRHLFRISFQRCRNYMVLSSIFIEKLTKLGIDHSKTNFWVETTVANPPNKFNLLQKLVSLDQGNKNINILFIARMVRSKGIYIAIDAFSELQEKLKDYNLKLSVAGDGSDLLEVKAYVSEKKIKNIEFLGFVQGDEKDKLFQKSHIFLFPTYYPEGLPTTILEAMIYGLPVISRYNAGISDVVDHGINGMLTDSMDFHIFTNFLEQLIVDKPLYRQMAQNNYNKAINSYSSQKVKERVLDIYDKITCH